MALRSNGSHASSSILRHASLAIYKAFDALTSPPSFPFPHHSSYVQTLFFLNASSATSFVKFNSWFGCGNRSSQTCELVTLELPSGLRSLRARVIYEWYTSLLSSHLLNYVCLYQLDPTSWTSMFAAGPDVHTDAPAYIYYSTTTLSPPSLSRAVPKALLFVHRIHRLTL